MEWRLALSLSPLHFTWRSVLMPLCSYRSRKFYNLSTSLHDFKNFLTICYGNPAFWYLFLTHCTIGRCSERLTSLCRDGNTVACWARGTTFFLLLLIFLVFFPPFFVFSWGTWLVWPIFSIQAMVISFSLGLGPIPWIIMSEVRNSNFIKPNSKTQVIKFYIWLWRN